MVNISDLVLAVKEEKEFRLFDQIKFICQTLGKNVSETPFGVYEYAPKVDDLKLYLIEGTIKTTGTLFQHALVKDSKDSVYFDYFNTDISAGKGIVDKYVFGEWEKLVKEHYNMSLCNI
jgi:hypothetical protein